MFGTFFLQVLDDGRLTDGQGRTVDFSNTVIILTSNIGSELLLKAAKEGEITEKVKNQVMEKVRQHFRPEFLNRLDDIVIFQPLGVSQLNNIVKLQLQGLSKRLRDRDIELKIDDLAVSLILEQSYDPSYGARPLKRFLEKTIATRIGRMLISGELDDHAIVAITKEKNELAFSVKKKTSPSKM